MRLFAVVCISLCVIGHVSCYPQKRESDEEFHDEVEEENRPVPQYLKFNPEDAKAFNLKQRGFNIPSTPQANQIPTGFRSTVSPPLHSTTYTSDHVDNTASSAQQFRRPFNFEENYPVPRQQQPVAQAQVQHRRPGPSNQFRQQIEEEKELLDEEKEEPDRLSLLLPNSKFECNGKNTGYYADDGLNCEVFHYCQENVKHSWICPDGFTFHQVHLICMPPTGDNICQKSSNFHFVNEYLYKPVNAEEVEKKPNVTLRYSDRYFPENYHYGNDFEEEQEAPQPPRRQPIQTGFQPQLIRRPAQPTQTTHFAPTLRPESIIPSQFRPQSQVFHSPEDVNISLQQRRPFLSSVPKTFSHPSHREDIDDDYDK